MQSTSSPGSRTGPSRSTKSMLSPQTSPAYVHPLSTFPRSFPPRAFASAKRLSRRSPRPSRTPFRLPMSPRTTSSPQRMSSVLLPPRSRISPLPFGKSSACTWRVCPRLSALLPRTHPASRAPGSCYQEPRFARSLWRSVAQRLRWSRRCRR